MKYCMSCGAQMKDDVKFCPSCGAPNNTASGSTASGYTAGQGYNQYTQPYGQSVQAPASTNGLAIASLVLGICSLIFGWFVLMIPAILAIIFGAVGLKMCKEKGQAGRGLAIAGLVLGIIALVIFLIIVIYAMSIISYGISYYNLFNF